MLTGIGIAFICFGAWFAGVLYVGVGADPAKKVRWGRVIAAYAACFIFIGEGVILITGL